MSKFLILFLLCAICATIAMANGAKIHYMFFTTTINDMMKFTEPFEGRKARQYKCPAGFQTIGVGHRVRNGENFYGMKLTEEQIDFIYRKDIVAAYISAKCSVKDFDSLPHGIKLVLVDMNFNLGKAGFRKFKRAIAACDSRDWKTMAKELRNSKWYKQTGKRSKNHVAMLENLAA